MSALYGAPGGQDYRRKEESACGWWPDFQAQAAHREAQEDKRIAREKRLERGRYDEDEPPDTEDHVDEKLIRQPESLPGQLPLFGDDDCSEHKNARGTNPGEKSPPVKEDSKVAKKIVPDDSGADKTSEAVPDPFSPEQLRLSQNFQETAGVKRELLRIPVRKPNKTWFVRVHPSEDYRIETAVLELKDETEDVYWVVPQLHAELASMESALFTPRALYLAVSRAGNPFIWPIRLPGPDGRPNEWNLSSMDAANHAVKQWVRVVANRSMGAYEVLVADAKLPDPVWPEKPMSELLRLAFKDRVVD